MKNLELPRDKTILVFDDKCGICSEFLWWVHKNDSKGIFHFSGWRYELSTEFGLRDNSIHILNREYILSGAEAIKFVINSIESGLFLKTILRFIPTKLLTVGYSVFSRFRRSILPSRRCRIETQFKNKFLSDF